MQGYLDMWSGFFKRWSRYYFQIKEETLLFGPEKYQIQGRIHLQIAQIVTTIDDPVCLLIHTGTQTLRLRAHSIQQKVHWYKKLKAIQKKAQSSNYIKQLSSASTKNSQVQLLEQLNVQLWRYHADLQNNIDELLQRIKGTGLKTIVDKIRITVQEIKLKNSQALKIIQNITGDSNAPRHHYNDSNDFIDYNNDNIYADQTKFLSFSQQKVGRIFQRQNSMTPKLERNSTEFYNVNHNNNMKNLPSHGSFMKKLSHQDQFKDIEYSQVQQFVSNEQPMVLRNQRSIKQLLIENNQVYTQLVKRITKNETRNGLPVKFTPEQRFPVLSILSGVGTDLTKFSFPVTMNQPLSMLQKGCQRMYYSELLNQANRQQDPVQRMLYVAAFLVSQNAFSDSRTKKPFNPLLGETFEYLDRERGFEYLCQQVSHHPPISAMHIRSDSFQFFDNSKSKMTFANFQVRIVPESKAKIILHHLKDQYIFTKPNAALNNLVRGKLYIEVSGNTEIKCKQFGTSCTLKYKQKGFLGNRDDFVEGAIFLNNQEVITLKGKWSEYLDAQSQKGTVRVWQKRHPIFEKYYNFNQYTLQLNHLNQQLLNQIAPTDTRLRPDQRALEYQETQLAESQKNRLQEKQRSRRRHNQSINKKHQELWFNLQTDEDGNQFYVSNHKYWDRRIRGRWDECLDLF